MSEQWDSALQAARERVEARLWHPTVGKFNERPACGIVKLDNGGVQAAPITRDNCYCGAFAAIDYALRLARAIGAVEGCAFINGVGPCPHTDEVDAIIREMKG